MIQDLKKSNQKIWDKHAKKDDSASAARDALAKLAALESSDLNSSKSKKEFVDTVRQALVLSKSAALKTPPEEASCHLQNAIEVLLGHYPVSNDEAMARERGKDWDNTIFENQSAQLVCLRDMLSLLEFVAKVAPSEEINNLTKQILVLLLELSEENFLEVFALISLIEKADYQRAAEAFKVYSTDYCFSDKNPGLDQIITVSTRFLERAIQAKDHINGILALENIFKVFSKDQGFAKRITIDMAQALFPSLKEKIVEGAADKIRGASASREKLQELISELFKLAFVGVGDGQVKELQKII